MGDNDLTAPTASVEPTEESATKAAQKKEKKDKKPPDPLEVKPHVTGRLLQVEIDASGIAFTLKGKKGKAEAFSLKGMDTAAVPAAAALLAGLLDSKSKLRVEFTASGDSRTVNKMRAAG